MGLPLAGRTVLVTGTIDGLSRDQARQAIVDLGGTPAPGVSSKVDLIVLGEGAGISKTAKARALNISVLDSGTFAELAALPDTWDGTVLGSKFAAHDEAHPEPVPEPSLYDTDPDHRVGKAVLSVPVGDTYERQVRLSCTCGYKWRRNILNGDDRCPASTTPNGSANPT